MSNRYNFLGYSVLSESLMSIDDQLVIQSLIVLLTTPKKSLPLRPNFGSNLRYLLFEPIGSVNESYLRTIANEYVRESIKYERRVSLSNVIVKIDQDRNTVNVIVTVRINLSGAEVSVLYPISDAPISEVVTS